MVIIANGQGTVTDIIPEHIYQGSNLANEIIFVAPFSESDNVLIAFNLPNGINLKQSLMVKKQLDNVVDGDGAHYNAWSYMLPASATEYRGEVTAQLYVMTGNATVATSSAVFRVEKGVPVILPDEPTEDVYTQIIRLIGTKQDSLTAGMGINVNALANGNTVAIDFTQTLTEDTNKIAPNKVIKDYIATELEDYNLQLKLESGEEVSETVLDSMPHAPENNQLITAKGIKDFLTKTSFVPDATYPDLTAGHAIAAENAENAVNAQKAGTAENDGTGNNIAEQFAAVSSDIDGLREDITNESHFRGMFDSVEALRAAYPAATPNDYAYIVGGNQWIYQNGAWTDSEKPTPNTAVPRGTSIPLMDGIGSAGSSSAYASEDHRHPSDTNKVNKSGDTMTGALNAPATNTTKAVTKEVILSDPNDTAEIPTSGYQALTVDAKGVEVGEASVPLNLRGVTTRPVYTQNGATGRGLAFVNYGTCTSSSGMTTKEVVLPGFVLETGTRIYVKFTYSATIASSTVGTAFKLNVNNTGAKALFVNGANSSSFYPMLWKAGAICEFIYDGTNWNLIAPHILNSGYINTTSVTNITNANDTVTSYYRSSDGNSWYRKWASGWKECGGKITNGSGEFNYTLPLVFNSVNYNVIASFAEGGSSVVSLYGKPYTSQSMQIKKWYGGGAASEPCYYYACGY